MALAMFSCKNPCPFFVQLIHKCHFPIFHMGIANPSFILYIRSSSYQLFVTQILYSLETKDGFFVYDLYWLFYGACGYGSLANESFHGYIAGAVPLLYKQGAGCGVCFQVRCKNKKLCSPIGAKIVLTDQNYDNRTDFVLSRKAFSGMARWGMAQQLLQLGMVDIEYKRVPCGYKNKNLLVRIEEWSNKPYYLAMKFLYQGGQTEIKSVDIAQVGRSDWEGLKRNYGAIWDTSKVPEGALQLRLVVTSGYDNENWIWTNYEIPADWKSGETYDTGIQIEEIAKESCSPRECGDRIWK
ncbi:hypothetical protein IC582_001363 [Cucumis melo]